MNKLPLLFLSIISLCAIPCKSMQKYSEYIVKQEREHARELIKTQGKSNANHCAYNKTLRDLDDELEQAITRRVIIKYFVAPVTAAIGTAAALKLLFDK